MATAARSGNRDIIRFEPNKPETVNLRFSEGKEIDGKFGPQFMYTTTDDRIFFLDPPVAARLDALSLAMHEEVRIGKMSRAKGGTEWMIEQPQRLQPVAPVAARPAPPANEPPPFAPEETAAAPAAVQPLRGKFSAAYMVAIDVLQEAQVYATRKGMPLAFTGEDVRALAATLIIDQQRGGR